MAMKSIEMTVLSSILHHQSAATPILAVLVDPDKRDAYMALLPYIKEVDMIFVGGSTGTHAEECVELLRQYTAAPIILFPGNTKQFTPSADALLFLTLLNSRRAEVLIEPHVQTAMTIRNSGIEVIPMGYILIDGERKSSVEIVSHCTPIAQNAVDDIIRHAVAGQLLGKQLIYLEAGSGAQRNISIETIRMVRENITVPLVVGGGITSVEQMCLAFRAGANIVVIGNHFERYPNELPIFIHAKKI
jgi:putative glycerol-1-phosphate prenyltransferase